MGGVVMTRGILGKLPTVLVQRSKHGMGMVRVNGTGTVKVSVSQSRTVHGKGNTQISSAVVQRPISSTVPTTALVTLEFRAVPRTPSRGLWYWLAPAVSTV